MYVSDLTERITFVLTPRPLCSYRTDHLIDIVTLYSVETGLVTRYAYEVSAYRCFRYPY